MIKTHYYVLGRKDWNEWRTLNIQSIVEVMEDNLQGLRNVSPLSVATLSRR